MGDRLNLSVDTLMQVFPVEEQVDIQTLKCGFAAADLVEETKDHFIYRNYSSHHLTTLVNNRK